MFKYLIAIIVGAVSVAAYAPLEWWWLMPLCLAVLFQLMRNAKEWQASKLVFLFSLGQFGVGASWVYVSLQTYGNMPVWMASIAVFFFVVAYSLVIGFAGFLYSRFSEHHGQESVKNIVLFASLWVLAEWSRSILFTGFPWLDVGYSQTTQWLSGYAPLGSVYLVSFVTVLVSAMLSVFLRRLGVELSMRFLKTQSVSNVSMNNVVSKKLIIFYVGTIAVLVGSGAYLRTIHWSSATGQSFEAVIVQGNVSVDQKWLNDNQSQIVSDYVDQINQYSADLVILPETALPVALHQTDERLWNILRGQNKALLSGVIERDLVSNKIYNSANLVCGSFSGASQSTQGSFYQGQQIYRKQHLVPFGEYLPLRDLLGWLLNYLQIPMSDFSAGQAIQSLSCEGLDISLSICYEDAFAAEMRNAIVKNSQNGVLINISEDAWFGDSLAPHQRVQMAQMRAIELARPMLRSANSGPSTYIDFQGNVLATTKQFQKDSMQVSVMPRLGKTPFIHFGMWIIYGCLMLVICFIVMPIVFAKKKV